MLDEDVDDSVSDTDSVNFVLEVSDKRAMEMVNNTNNFSGLEDKELRDFDAETPPQAKKPRSLCGAAAYGTKDCESKFLFISCGKVDSINFSFYCKVCQKDVSNRHQGVSDTSKAVVTSIMYIKSMENNS